MKKLGVFLMATLFLAVSAPGVVAAKGKGKGKAGKAAEKVGPAPAASTEQIAELKGDYKWGMTSKQVVDKINERIAATYAEKIEKSAADPSRNDALRKQLRGEVSKTSKNFVKFDGQRTGWDVSIIDQEISQNVGQSMVFAKEKTSTRYFFFMNDSLYKMFVAFDKEMLAGKGFEDFGAGMQAKFGRAQPVYLTRNVHGVQQKKLDHFLWGSTTGDGLRLVDRSEFYDVYCLVVYDGAIEHRAVDAKKASSGQASGSIVDAVLTEKPSDRDENDNVIDRITGKEVLKPGDRRGSGGNVKVETPAPSKSRSGGGLGSDLE
jgi:hypothetical protein